MPAKSKAQRRVAGMAKAIQEGELSPSYSPQAAQMAKSMKPGDLGEFAKTKEKGLPVHTLSHHLKKVRMKR